MNLPKKLRQKRNDFYKIKTFLQNCKQNCSQKPLKSSQHGSTARIRLCYSLRIQLDASLCWAAFSMTDSVAPCSKPSVGLHKYPFEKLYGRANFV